jgi:hypothetical protein
VRASEPQTGLLVKRGVTLASIAVGDVVNDFEWLLKNELKPALSAAGSPAAAQAALKRLLDSGMTARGIAEAIGGSRYARWRIVGGRGH